MERQLYRVGSGTKCIEVKAAKEEYAKTGKCDCIYDEFSYCDYYLRYCGNLVSLI